MKRNSSALILASVFFTLFCSIVSLAQNSSQFWISVNDDAYMFDTMHLYFGNFINATHGYDSLTPTIIESQPYPPPPSFDTRWINVPPRRDMNAIGSIPFNFVEVPTNTGMKDTFLLEFENVTTPSATFTFHWPNATYLSQRCDSMFVVAEHFSNTLVNMFTQDSLVIPDATDNSVDRLFIYKFGVKLVDGMNLVPIANGITGIRSNGNNRPSSYLLNQNYPNPFNPATQISYTITKGGNVTLKIYNVLGQQVTTLVNGKQEVGNHSVTWNALNIPSGVYFYRIIAGDFVQTKKMVLMK